MEFKFADIGEGITEGEIVRWLVEEGDQVDENEVLVQVETDKAIVDIPSPCDGTIESLPHAEGDTIEVGEVLAVIDAEDEEAVSESTTVVGEISTDAEILDDPDEDEETSGESVLATPKTRKLAEELGVDITQVSGTGDEGRVTEEDVRAAAEDGSGGMERVKLEGVRKRIAERTQTSHKEIPQVTHMDEIDVTALTGRIEELRDDRDLAYKLTITPFLLKAIVESLPDHPYVNSSFDGDEIVLKHDYNIGVTVDTEDGLIVPVLRNAGDMELFDIGREVNRLAREARERTIELSDLKGGTFTLTNIGFIGGTWATPQVYHPQAAILAAGRATERPVATDGDLTVREMLPVSLSFDHRILDGADAARFVNDLKERLQNPETLLD